MFYLVHRGIFNCVQGEVAPDNVVLGDQIPKLFLSRGVHLVNDDCTYTCNRLTKFFQR